MSNQYAFPAKTPTVHANPPGEAVTTPSLMYASISLLLLACGLCQYMWFINISVAYVLVALIMLGISFHLRIAVAGCQTPEGHCHPSPEVYPSPDETYVGTMNSALCTASLSTNCHRRTWLYLGQTSTISVRGQNGG
ncbi:hypothetical protein BDM02DRAFT_3120314 [Thelephora ganbajun]|uniref:Uncharacterized protein n=1 Tax=Thelephora ganbajun TaxID=370292 RepID=A0ACB6Z6U5_THEGA|nr:hypothetical protein BDM02DRAFT_3120314 [Thelephora ganbajun]